MLNMGSVGLDFLRYLGKFGAANLYCMILIMAGTARTVISRMNIPFVCTFLVKIIRKLFGGDSAPVVSIGIKQT
jgi:hypothetical protein